jgi:hypothetical protein
LVQIWMTRATTDACICSVRFGLPSAPGSAQRLWQPTIAYTRLVRWQFTETDPHALRLPFLLRDSANCIHAGGHTYTGVARMAYRQTRCRTQSPAVDAWCIRAADGRGEETRDADRVMQTGITDRQDEAKQRNVNQSEMLWSMVKDGLQACVCAWQCS